MGYYDPVNHQRRSIRLKGYDYSQAGAYFLTICTKGRECLFGEIVDGKMILNNFGKIVANEWKKSAEIRGEIRLGEWVVMPNHFHGIVIINDKNYSRCWGNRPAKERTFRRVNRPVDPTTQPSEHPTIKPGPRPQSIASLMAGFKSAVTVRVNALRNTPGAKLWQRNYYEHISRDNLEYQKITTYIRNNPKNWHEDKLYDSQRQ